MSESVHRGEDVILEIDRLSGDGKTVARRDGMVYFVEHAVPGDTVRARIWKSKKNYVEARAMEVLKPSTLRVDPRCKHFGVCGGCKWQNLSYEAQLKFKHQFIVDAFERIAGIQSPNILPVMGCAEPYFYRNKMEFTFSTRRWLTTAEMEEGEPPPGVHVGLHVPQRYDKVVDLEECWLQSEMSAAIVNAVREIARVWGLTVYSTETHEGYLRHLVIREGKQTGELMINLVTTYDLPEVMQNLTKLLIAQFPSITTIVNNVTSRKSMVALGESEKVYHGPGYITERIGECTFRISANSFFQTNTLQAANLYAVTKRLAALVPSDVVYDLYSGTGTIAIYVADAVERVIGIELASSSIVDAERNAQANHVSNCYFLEGDLKDRLTTDRDWLSEHPRPSVIITDPPRNGMHEKVVLQMIKLAPGRIVYVSCNPSTQARDAKLLCEGGYTLEQVQPVDMFPHTDHIEAVALFTRSEG